MLFIKIEQYFDKPIEQVFADLSDHKTLGQILGFNITRIKDSKEDNKNALGSERRVAIFPTPAFVETITAFKANQYIAYQVTQGSPIKNHKGELFFSRKGAQTHLLYTIEFEPKLKIPMWGAVLKVLIQRPIIKGLQRYALKRTDSI
ncbi:SRPBCC family protein [Paraglaciecola aestuariivivens]